MTRLYVLVVLVAAGCTDSRENPVVVPHVLAQCGMGARLVTDACTKLGPDDGCTEVDDVCVALCDGRASCDTVGGLRALNGWPTAPSGYCVVCTDAE